MTTKEEIYYRKGTNNISVILTFENLPLSQTSAEISLLL